MQRMKEKKAEPLDFAASAGMGALFALGLTFLFLFAASLFVVSGRLPEGWMAAVTVLALFLSSLLGALFAIRRSRSRALFVGLSEGVMLYALTFIGGVFAEVPRFFGGLSPFLFLAAVLGGVAAGFIRPRRRGSGRRFL